MIKAKIKTLTALKKLLSRLRKERKKIVFTNGCFDIIHYGHVNYLESAKKLGDILVLGLNSDLSVKRIKGKDRPVNSELCRAGVLAALESVDYVVIFNEDTPLALIKQIKPDILVKGADWKSADIVGSEFIREYGGKIVRTKLEPGLSTTRIIDKIAKNHGKR